MITHGTKLTVCEDGTELPIQDIRIGDRVFNPMTGATDEVLDMLQREIALPNSNVRLDSLRPVVIPKDAFSAGRPRLDLHLSSKQEILVPVSNPKSPRPIAYAYSCSDVSSKRDEGADSVSYYAMFFSEPRFLDLSGVLVRAYTTRDMSCLPYV